jgi:hypothetical protein
MTEEEIEFFTEIQGMVLKFSEDIMFNLNVEPHMIAGIFASTALRIYKTNLTPEEFESMMDVISETRDKILPLDYTEEPKDLH